jgi:hypothetical protein
LLTQGLANRKTVGLTKAVVNIGIFTIHIAKVMKNGQFLTGRITFVDLVSESAGNVADELKGIELNPAISDEINLFAKNIKGSLFALQEVISALASNCLAKKQGLTNKKLVPYNNSILTRYLSDALGGNSKTTWISCASCVPTHAGYKSDVALKFAERARHIVNYDVTPFFVTDVAAFIEMYGQREEDVNGAGAGNADEDVDDDYVTMQQSEIDDLKAESEQYKDMYR